MAAGAAARAHREHLRPTYKARERGRLLKLAARRLGDRKFKAPFPCQRGCQASFPLLPTARFVSWIGDVETGEPEPDGHEHPQMAGTEDLVRPLSRLQNQVTAFGCLT